MPRDEDEQQPGPGPATDGTGDPEPTSSHTVPASGQRGGLRRVNRRVARARLSRMSRLTLTRGSLLAAVITLVLGLGVVAQVRSTQAGDLENLRETDLVALLDDVTNRADDLEDEVRELQADRERLTGDEGAAAAAEAARSRLETYQILAGTVPVSGEGVALTVTDPAGQISTTTMINLLQELRDAGAEAIQVGGVRVVADTWIGEADGGLTVHGEFVVPPYRVTALGDAHTLSAALAIPGGFNDTVRRAGGEVSITEGDTFTIEAVAEPRELRYADPVPATEGR